MSCIFLNSIRMNSVRVAFPKGRLGPPFTVLDGLDSCLVDPATVGLASTRQGSKGAAGMEDWGWVTPWEFDVSKSVGRFSSKNFRLTHRKEWWGLVTGAPNHGRPRSSGV